MSGLTGLIGGGAQARGMLGVQKDGLDPFVFSDAPVDGAITTADMIDQPKGSTARWMFEEAARQHGLDPDTVVRGSAAHDRITQDLDTTLRTLKEHPLPKGEAAHAQALRGAIRDAVALGGPALTPGQAATLATMPGAQAFSSPGAQAALRGAASIARHPAAQGGLAAGVAGTIAAGEIIGRQETAPQEQTRATPFVGLDKAGERREDDMCAPQGTDGAWIVKNQSMNDDARAYQRQIAGTPELPGKLMVEYRVTSRTGGGFVDFDGCAFDRPGKPLLDAKFGYGRAFKQAEAGEIWARAGIVDGLAKQADRQAEITLRSHPVEWHGSDAEVTPKIEEQQRIGSNTAPNMTTVYTPAIEFGR